MALVGDGITNVEAFAIPAGIAPDGTNVPQHGLLTVRWESSHTDKLHQVYVNERLAGATIDEQQRQIIIGIPLLLQTAVKIEVYATEPGLADVEQDISSSQLSPQQGRIQLDYLRNYDMPAGGHTDYYFDSGSGTIDYDTPLNTRSMDTWLRWQDKSGFGLSSFGLSDFGYDASATIGFGAGFFGNEKFGFDADSLSWRSRQFEAGEYKFAVRVTDRFGNVDDGPAQTTSEPAHRSTASTVYFEASVLLVDDGCCEVVLFYLRIWQRR